jgi:hypothetical protein
MSSPVLTHLTDKPDCFSADVSPISCTKRYSQVPHESYDETEFVPEDQCPRLVLPVAAECARGSVDSWSAASDQEAGESEIPASLARRLYCYWVLQELDSRELTEAAHALTQLTGFRGPPVQGQADNDANEDSWPIEPDTQVRYTIQQMARAWRAVAESIEQDDAALSVDPDDYPAT